MDIKASKGGMTDGRQGGVVQLKLGNRQPQHLNRIVLVVFITTNVIAQ
jgi:hypothetical protein